MSKRNYTKYIHEGEYVARIVIEIIDSDTGWAPYISLDDALKLDDVRKALQDNDLKTAGSYGEIFKLTPVAM